MTGSGHLCIEMVDRSQSNCPCINPFKYDNINIYNKIINVNTLPAYVLEVDDLKYGTNINF
jgi:hypothetical protein